MVAVMFILDIYIVILVFSKQVTCLCISLDGMRIYSGAHDSTVRIWDIDSKQCTKVIHHKGMSIV